MINALDSFLTAEDPLSFEERTTLIGESHS